jgi:glycosyltransferase involved in cell wall biosynthesis
MKIVLIITCLGVGGAETQVVNLADRLDAAGHEVLVMSLTDEVLVSPKSEKVRVVSLGVRKTPAALIRAYAHARSVLRQFSPDVVHSHMVHANIFTRMLRLSVPMPRLICTAHNTNEGGAMWMWAYRLTDRLAHLTTNVSQEAVDRYIACSAVAADKTMAVYNGIDCESFRFDPELRKKLRSALEVPEGAQVLLAAGRCCEQKDYPNLLHAFQAVSRRQEDCVLWIAGTGSDQAQLEALSDRLGIAGRVRFLGLRRDVPALMSAADIFVLSSAWEGFPLVIGEAMACERIVVSTNSGGIAEWLGQSDYLVPIRDSAALADALARALSLDDEARRACGLAARERVLARFSLHAVAQRWEQIYKGDFRLGLSDARTIYPAAAKKLPDL